MNLLNKITSLISPKDGEKKEDMINYYGKKIKVSTHDHELIYGGNHYLTICDNCKKEIEGMPSFNCSKCEYDYCVKCYETNIKDIEQLPDEPLENQKYPIIKSNLHNHPLIYSTNHYLSTCSKCEMNCNKLPTYCCAPCKYDLCIKCASETFDLKDIIAKYSKILKENNISEDPNSFVVYEKLSKPKEIWKSEIFKKGVRSETSSGGKPFTTFAHPIIEGFYKAYITHCPITISPDTIWLLIMQGFSRFVYQNSDRLKEKFVSFSGKKELEVTLVSKSFDTVSDEQWNYFLDAIVKKISDYTGEKLVSSLKFDFSTSTKLLERVGLMCIMSSMQKYFDYTMHLAICGFPYINLEGTLDDWKKILEKAKFIGTFDIQLEWWIRDLSKVLEKIIETKKYIEENKKESIDKEFWKDIIRNEKKIIMTGNGCIPGKEKEVKVEYIEGWILKFVPYSKEGKFDYNRKLNIKEGFKDLAPEIIDFPVKVINSDDSINYFRINVGFLGMRQNESNYMVKPEIGYYAEKITEEEYGQRDKKIIPGVNEK